MKDLFFHFTRILFLAVVVSIVTPAWAAPPLIVADDIITISGGTVSPDNPDVYVIDAGVYIPAQTYSITLLRPKGESANYPVTIEYMVIVPEYGSFIHDDYGNYEAESYNSGLMFAAGETTKTFTFTAGSGLQNETAQIYLILGQGNRTKAQYPVIKINFTNPNPVIPTTGTCYPNPDGCLSFGGFNPFYTMGHYTIGEYCLISVDAEYFGHFNLLNDTRLRINQQYLDHEAYPANITDILHAKKQTILLKPEQAVGTISNRLDFLYKISENPVINNYIPTGGDEPNPCFVRQADSLISLQMAADQTMFDKLYVEDNNDGFGDAMPLVMNDYYYATLLPRFAPISSDETSYDIGETIILTIPVLNSKLLQKVYPNNAWLDNINVTLDGGETFLNRAYLTYDGVNNNIIAVAEAKNKTGSLITVTAEVVHHIYDMMGQADKYTYIYGANTAFSVTNNQAEFQAITSLEITLPENNQINLNTHNAVLHAKVNPTAATFKTGTWTSSNPTVADISVNGVLTPKAYGKTIITFTSEEVAYRTENELPVNDEILIKSFDIYVVGDYPEWKVTSDKDEYDKVSYESGKMYISHNLKNNAWTVDGELAVEVIHSDSVKYHSITDAIEITPEMIQGDGYGNWINYNIPFDEKTFPKDPTAFEKYFTDSIWAKPYRVVMSMPLKQTIGDIEMTCVLRDTFDVHLLLPEYPVVKIIQNAPAEMQSGETMTVKYEIKYLNKIQDDLGSTGFGFRVYSGVGEHSDYEGYNQHPHFFDEFYYNSKFELSPSPDWLELTDMGSYYNAIATFEYAIPAPNGIVKLSTSNNPYEEFQTSLSTYNMHRYGTRYSRVNTTTNAYTFDFDLFTEKSSHIIAGQDWGRILGGDEGDAIPLKDWDEEGYRTAEIVRLINAANESGDFSEFYTYMKSKTGKELYIKSPKCVGELVAGVTRTGSNDTIYTSMAGQHMFDILYSFNGGDYDLVLSYPKQHVSKSFHYSSDSITGQIYLLRFSYGRYNNATGRWARSISPDEPVNISYMNGDSIEVNIVKPGNGERTYAIYEPKGIIGQVYYNQYIPLGSYSLEGSIIPQSLGEGGPPSALLSPVYSLRSNADRAVYQNICSNSESDKIAVTLLDEDSGERITKNVQIHYLGKKEVRDNFEEDKELVTEEAFRKFCADNNFVIGSSTDQNCDIIERPEVGYSNFCPQNQETSDAINRFYQSKVNEYALSHISTAVDQYVEGTAGSVESSTAGYYLIPSIKISIQGYDWDLWRYYEDGIGWQSAVYAMEIVAEGYQPKMVTFDPNPQTSKILDEGITVIMRKKTEALSLPNVNLWMEQAHVKGCCKVSFSPHPTCGLGRYFVFGITGYTVQDKQDLTTKGRNTVIGYERSESIQNVVLNLTLPLADGQSPQNLTLSTKRGSAAPSAHKVINYPGFKNKYVNVSYLLDTKLIDYGRDEQGNPIPENTVYPDVKYGNNVIAELPGLFNDEVNPKIYEDKITAELKKSIVLSPDKFDVKKMTDPAKTGGNADKGLDQALDFNFSLPDPIPIEIQTRYEDDAYYIRGVVSHNFVDDIPIVGQANMSMGLLGHAENFDAAFNEMKGALKMRTKNGTPRMSTIHTFAGIRGYLEGYGKYIPGHGYEYGLNEAAISVELSADAYTKTPLGGVTVGFGVEGVVSATMGISKPEYMPFSIVDMFTKAKFDLWLETQLSLDIRADVSAGVDIGIAGAEVGVTGRAGFKNMNKMIIRPYLNPNDNRHFQSGGYFNVYANMYAWAHAYFLIWSWEKEWKIFDVSKTWYYPNDDTNPYLSSDESSKMRSLAQVYKRSTLVMPNTIIGDVAANAYPLYFGDGNSLMLSNLKEYSDMNDDRISIYNSDNITDMLPSETLPAYGFDVVTSANDVSAVAYEQAITNIQLKAEKVSQETYIKTQSNNIDIFAAIKNGDEWQTTQLSDVGIETIDRKTDKTPKIAVSPDGTKAAVVWRSGFTKIDANGAKVSGDLKLSRYNGTSWTATPLNLGTADDLADYSLAIDGDSVVVAAMRMGTDSIGKIKLIYISKEDSIKHIETGRVGRKPQIVRTGDNYYISFMGQYAKDNTTNVNDIYLLATTKNGQLIDSISGFAGMPNKVSFAYKLLADHTTTSINDLAILYNVAKVVNENEVQNSLYTTKLGWQNGQIFASEPSKLLTVPEEHLIVSFDGYKQGNNIKAAATISNKNHGAIVVEETTVFENKIVCRSESFNMSDKQPGQDINIEFEVQNTGFKSITSLTIQIDNGAITADDSKMMPGSIQTVRGTTKVPVNNTDSIGYIITATFVDGSTNTAVGMLDLTAYQMKVSLVSLKTTNAKNTAVLQIQNNSATPLTSQHEVTIGVYEDMFGETLYPGTKLKTLPASELYADGVAKIATTAVDIPVVDEVKSVYAIAKVKRNITTKSLRSSSDEEQTDKSYANIQLYPNKTDVPTKIETPTTEVSSDLRVYVRNNCAIIEGRVSEPIKVYTLAGILLKAVIQSEDPTVIPLPKGIYLIKVDEHIEKVVI